MKKMNAFLTLFVEDDRVSLVAMRAIQSQDGSVALNDTERANNGARVVNLKKAIQIVSRILKKNKGRLNYTKLIKLLYIADRRAFERWDLPITGDNYCSMHNGPVLSEIYDLVMERHGSTSSQVQWNAHFARDGYDLVSVRDDRTSDDEMSVRELKLVDEVEKEFHASDWTRLKQYTHDHYSEWHDPGNSSSPISVKDILQALGRTEDEIGDIESDIEFFKKESNR